MLVYLLIRRTRNHILRWYGFDAETHQPVDPPRFREYLDRNRHAYIIVGGKHQFFPKRELNTITYSIEATYQGLYQKLRGYLGRPSWTQTSPPSGELTYARYGLWHYVTPQKQKQSPYTELHQAGANLRGLMRVMLFKRFESSVYAFRETLKRLLRIHRDFLTALSDRIVPAGEEAQQLLYESDQMEEEELFDALSKVSGRYNIADFHTDLLTEHIEQDIRIISEMLQLVAPITPDKDDKLQALFLRLNEPVLLRGTKQPRSITKGKLLIFTQYADTAQYLYDNLNPNGRRDDIDVIYSGDKSRERLVGRFAPKANPWFRFHSGETELSTVIATDVLSEGINLQDCSLRSPTTSSYGDKIINYDLHWNPVRNRRLKACSNEAKGIFAFLRAGRYQQLVLLDTEGNVVSRELSEASIINHQGCAFARRSPDGAISIRPEPSSSFP